MPATIASTCLLPLSTINPTSFAFYSPSGKSGEGGGLYPMGKRKVVTLRSASVIPQKRLPSDSVAVSAGEHQRLLSARPKKM
jgi:hypothetical protein